MYIDLGTHVITNDAYNFILNLKVVTQTGDNVGKPYLRSMKYYSTLEDLISALPSIVMLSDKDSKSIDELSKNLYDHAKTIKEMLNVN